MITNSTTRFGDRVENYVKYRPGYPKSIIPFLQSVSGLDKNFTIADIGSGTGILSKMFLENGNTVYAVEPNKEMRSKAEELLGTCSLFISISGTAEHTTLDDDFADMIVAGQAFHWFNPAETKKEFGRISKRDAYAILMWNEREVSSEFEKAYEQLLRDYAIDYTQVDHRNISQQAIEEFFAPLAVRSAVVDNEQVFDFDGLKGRLLSSSYAPNEEHPKYQDMIIALQKIFEKYKSNNQVRFKYQTKLYAGKLTG
jgi:SAM-dependent methyltransferase